MKQPKVLSSASDIRQYFSTNEIPTYFISATNFNLMGMHDWVRSWLNINLVDCYNGLHPQVLMVADDHAQVFESIEEINRYLLNSASVRALLQEHQSQGLPRGRAIFLFFDEAIEALCAHAGLDIVLPKNSLVREIDSKIVTTELGNEAGVPSVPNVLTKISSYADLERVASQAQLGTQWVVQSAYGDSGKTTYFISGKADYDAVAAKIEREDRVKVMRRINCVSTAIEACATRWGTFVGPLLSELIGIPSLTPYAGGWCGNELYPDAFGPAFRQQVLVKTQAIGDALYRRGYRGNFELDYLIDLDSNDVYLGELNARITGISAMTNLSDFSARTIPLFLFHLLEYEPDVDLRLDVDAFNQEMLVHGAAGTAAQLILKYTDARLKIITAAPVSGVYRMNAGGDMELIRCSFNRRDALAENEAYVMRIMNAGEYAYKGGDLAILFVNCVIREPRGQLNAVGKTWVGALQKCFTFRELGAMERSLVEQVKNPANVKSEPVR